MSASALKTFLDVPSETFLEFLKTQGQGPFRYKQIQDWFFRRGAANFDEMVDLPEPLRQALSEKYLLHPLHIRRKEESKLDGTIRYFFNAKDRATVSTVYLPEGDHLALCLSTQVGCAYKCQFCASGLVPFKRQLSAAEIIDQILLIMNDQKRKPTNILFMGMGEPLANYTQVMQSIQWMTSPRGLGMGHTRIAISTSGLIPQIEKMVADDVKVKLAISLHAVRDEVREKIMPVSGKFKVRPLVKAAKAYALKNNMPVMFEYILLEGVNDFELDANRLAYLVKGFPHVINLIPYNPVPGLPYARPSKDSVHRFHGWLRARNVPVYIRKPKGLDIGSACGQLGNAA